MAGLCRSVVRAVGIMMMGPAIRVDGWMDGWWEINTASGPPNPAISALFNLDRVCLSRCQPFLILWPTSYVVG